MQYSISHFPTEYIYRCTWYQSDIIVFFFIFCEEKITEVQLLHISQGSHNRHVYNCRLTNIRRIV